MTNMPPPKPGAGSGLATTSAAPMLVRPADSWQAKYILYLEGLQKAGKPAIIVTRLGDCPPNWFRTIPEGRA